MWCKYIVYVFRLQGEFKRVGATGESDKNVELTCGTEVDGAAEDRR